MKGRAWPFLNLPLPHLDCEPRFHTMPTAEEKEEAKRLKEEAKRLKVEQKAEAKRIKAEEKAAKKAEKDVRN